MLRGPHGTVGVGLGVGSGVGVAGVETVSVAVAPGNGTSASDDEMAGTGVCATVGAVSSCGRMSTRTFDGLGLPSDSDSASAAVLGGVPMPVI